MELNYLDELEKIFKYIGKSNTIALATCSNNYPTVRLVSSIIYDYKIYFQTGIDLLKYEQIHDNKNVALCINNIQIEGTAKIIGKTNEKQNNGIMEIYKMYHENPYRKTFNDEKVVIIEINPLKITRWDYEDGKPYRIFIDSEEKSIKKEVYV